LNIFFSSKELTPFALMRRHRERRDRNRKNGNIAGAIAIDGKECRKS